MPLPLPLLLLVSMSQRPTWASRPAASRAAATGILPPPDLLWHLHPPSCQGGASGAEDLFGHLCSTEASHLRHLSLHPTASRQAGGCNIWAGWLVVGVLEIGVRAKPSLLLGRRLLGASAAQGGARQAACLERRLALVEESTGRAQKDQGI